MSAAELTRADLFLKDSNAVISACGKYRYWLHRRWNTGAGWAVFVMLNPSTADAETNDATIRKCIAFAKSWGLEGIIVVNLYAFRATDPKDLVKAQRAGVDVVGEENHSYVALAMEMADECFAELPPGRRHPGKVICGWGAHAAAAEQIPTMLGWIVASLLVNSPLCLGRTAGGMPMHPLYRPYRLPLEPYDWRPQR